MSYRPRSPLAARLAPLALLLGFGACGGARSSPEPAENPPTARAKDPADNASAAAAATAAGPERDAKLADLELLCVALNRDYVDGTLSDYFAGVQTKTAWGADVLRRGDDADKPGRFLAAQIELLSPGAADPALAACRELLDYVDEVE